MKQTGYDSNVADALFENLFQEVEKGNLTEDELLDDFLLIILAGHETT